MNIWKKAISVGTSAALLASLLTTAVAPAALASSTVTSVGTVPQGGTSTAEASFAFTEKAIGSLTGACTFTVTITDSLGGSTVHFVGAGTQSGPGSLDLAALIVGDNFFTVTIRDQDPLNIESVTVGGLKIKADTVAATGAIKANVTAGAACFTAAFIGGTVTARGKLSQAYGIGQSDFLVALDTDSCPFDLAGNVTVGTETVTPDAAPTLWLPGQYRFLALGDPFTINHLANEVVTQTATNCATTVLGSPGTVAKSLRYRAPAEQTRVNPGENNQWVANLVANERDSTTGTGSNDGPPWTSSFFSNGGTLTLTITTPGVTFSSAPRATATGGVGGLVPGGSGLLFTSVPSASAVAYGTLSADRMSATWKIDTKSTSAAWITWDLIRYDVAASVARGTEINVTLAASDGAVAPTSRSNAVVGRVFNVTSTSPVVYIGENNQTAGQVTIVETAAGFFQAGGGSNNTLVTCLRFNTFDNETFASAPWAKVTAGDLRLREGDVASPDNIVQAKALMSFGPAFDCYYWTVWTASTTASTIVLSGDEAGTGGLKINVPSGSPVGPVNLSVRTGVLSGNVFSMTLEAITQIALRQFRTQVAVTALSQPTIPVGSNGSKVGDIQIQETASGQLKTDEFICVEIVPNQNVNQLFDAYLKGLNTADVPIVTASNGVLTNAVLMNTFSCSGQDKWTGAWGNLVESFSFRIVQQSNTGNGKLVISNIKYATTNDAVEGPVQVNVFGQTDPRAGGTRIDFQALISNARIGGPVVLSIGAVSALGLRPTTGYSTKTPKTQAAGKYVTWKFTGGATLAGQRVNILVAVRINGAWGGPKYLKSAWADANGIVTFYWKAAAGTVLNARAQWPGDANHHKSTSPALGAYWK